MYRRKRARFLRAPLRADPTPPHRARGAPGRAAHIPVRRSTPRSCLALLLLLRAGSARSWGPCAAARRRRKARRGAHRMCASFSSVHGCTVEKPRSRRANLEGRMPGRRGTGVSFLLVTFLLDKHCAAGAARTPKAARRAEGRMPGVKKGGSAPAEGDETGDNPAEGECVRPPWRRKKKPQQDQDGSQLSPG